MNTLNDAGAGFENDTNKISIIDNNSTVEFGLQTKRETAEAIVNHIANLYGSTQI
jgi:phosphopantothenoylcysteine decarboxylase/phosphopantothenate--cysteine ligase